MIECFVNLSTAAKWCPGNDCDLAYENINGEAFDIVCKCGGKFCINCEHGPHAPMDCDKLVEWKKKQKEVGLGGSSKTDEWIANNSKPCPNCKSNIEKNYGCNHMTCR